jgi:RNA polymerase sigma factor (sigma-70 family)
MITPAIPPDREGFRRLFETHRDPMYRFLCRLTRDAHHAEDLLQETFTTLWRKRDQFRGEGSLEGYVRKVAFRTWLNARPRLDRGRAAALPDGEAPARDGLTDERVVLRLDTNARLAAVRAAVDGLPEGWREAFILFRYEGLSCAEIADVLDLTPKAVELRLARGLRAVAERLGVHRNGAPGRLPAMGP